MDERIAVLYGTDGTPAEVSKAGAVYEFGRTASLLANGDVQIGDEIYRLERELTGSDGRRGGLYRRCCAVAGWQVLASYRELDSTLTRSPEFKTPLADRAEAERRARRLVTDSLSSFGTRVRVELAWQSEDGSLGEPAAVLDGANHTRSEATRARFAGELLDWDAVPGGCGDEVRETASARAESEAVACDAEPALVWPQVQEEPQTPVEPKTSMAPELDWAAAVARAGELARAAFAGNEAVLARLDAALELAVTQPWTRLGDPANTFVMSDGRGRPYQINGRCQCDDYAHRRNEIGGWCKHRLGRALAIRAEKLQGEAGDAPTSPASMATEAADTQKQDSTEPACCQLDLSQVESFQRMWGIRPGVELTYTDRREACETIPYPDLVAHVQGLGWRKGTGSSWTNPAFDEWRAEELARGAAKWAAVMAERHERARS